MRRPSELTLKRSTAEEASRLFIRYLGELNELLKLSRDVDSEEDFNCLRDSVSKILTIALLEVLNPTYEQFPDLKPPELD